MKGLIIENEYEVDGYTLAFLKDNPTLFEKVQEELYCLHRSVEELVQYIIENDALIIASTFMYKDQLEDFLDALLENKIPPKTFFVYCITRKLNEWGNDKYFSEKEIFNKIKKLVEKGGVIYDFFEDSDSEKIYDGLGFHSEKYGRNKFVYSKVLFDKESNLFYTEHEQYSLEKIKKI